MVSAPAAWMPFPELNLERLEQSYRRLDARHYDYRAPNVPYEGVLTVNEWGLIDEYPALWRRGCSRVGFGMACEPVGRSGENRPGANDRSDRSPTSPLRHKPSTLWATADKLRANMDAAEYKHLVLGLIFLKYISDTFQAKRSELNARFTDPADDYFLEGSTPELLAAELEDRDYYREVNVFWVPEAARWEALRAAAKQTDIGKRIDEALSLIEVENPKLKGILDKRFARAQLPDGKLGELVDLVSTIGFGASASEARDVLGQVYEYFLGMFASAEGKRGGQFYTPRSIVKTLVGVLAPHHGKVYDRAAAQAACSCRARNSSRRTAASWATSPSSAKRPIPPPGAWPR
jgi:type I restriction enzyme M protein